MDEFCPLCRKNGCNNKIKPLQINFHEAVYLCESETCHWPYGYEEFQFIPRSIDELGKISTKKTNAKILAQKTKDGTHTIPISTELSMYTPPVTPSSDSSSSKEIMKGDSYISRNNSSTKTTIASISVSVKNENVPLKISSIFDIDSSIILPSKNFDQSQLDTLNDCDIRNDNEKNNRAVTLKNGNSRKRSQVPSSKSISKNRNIIINQKNVDFKKIKSSEQSDMKVNKKVVIFKEKFDNGIELTKERDSNHSINHKRLSINNSASQIEEEQLPKKISRIFSDREFQNENELLNDFSDELLTTNSTVKVENNSSVSSENQLNFNINNSKNNIMSESSLKSIESLISTTDFEKSNYIIDNSCSNDNLNLENFFNESLLENCANNTSEIDEEWIQSFLI